MQGRMKAGIVAILGALCGLAADAQELQIFGKVDAGVDSTHAGNGWKSRVISSGYNGSRLGFAGSQPVDDDLSVVFRIVEGFNTDDGSLGQGGRAFGREANVGISSKKFGTALIGRIETPAYRAHILFDAFSFGTAGLAEITQSASKASYQLTPLANTARVDNSLSYVSPDVAGLKFTGFVSTGEGSATLGTGFDGSLRYTIGAADFIGEFARQRGPGNGGSAGAVESKFLGASYDFGTFKTIVAYTDEKDNCALCTGTLARLPGVTGTNASEFKFGQIGVRVPVGKATLIAQYIRVQDDSQYAVDPGNRNANWIAAGMEYLLTKKDLVYATAGSVKNANGSLYALGTGSAQQLAGAVGPGNPRTTTLSLGINHSF
jgi:predicted porin